MDVGNITPATSKGFIDRTWRNYPMGGTNYVSALQWMIKAVELGHVDLGRRGDRLVVRQSAPIAVYGLFLTDGEPNPGTERDIEEQLVRMSQLPIFVQFVGIGEHSFKFLRKLDGLRGRLIDNAGFFDAKDVGNDPSKMMSAMLSEFPSYYREARKVGLVA